MMSLSLRKKFMLIVGGSIAAVLAVVAIIAVTYIGQVARKSVEDDLASRVALEAENVEGFFARYAEVARTFLSNPFLQNFFADHTQRGAPDSAMPQSETVFQLFENISEADDNIKSAFFGSALTGEYFYEAGRVGVESEGPDANDPAKGYFTTKRPWFNQAVEIGELYVSKPAVDSQDGSVSAVIQSSVSRNGQLLGVGGIDILISTLGDVLEKVKYQNEGTAFLLDNEQNIVYFPPETKALPLHTPLAEFDSQFNDSTGFDDVAASIQSQKKGMMNVTWQGEDYVVVFEHVTIGGAKMDWSMGLLVPESLVTAPVEQAFYTAVIVALIIIALVLGITYATGSTVVAPILRMKKAMAEIARGDGDLTKRLDVRSNDEIGELATEFNRFTDKLRELLSQTAMNTQAVAAAAQQLKDVSQNTSAEISQERDQVDNVSTAVTEMAATVTEISDNAAQSSQAATLADEEVRSGTVEAQNTMSEIKALADAINDAVSVVNGLSQESDNIGAVIDVINSIAEQTNLLALNAAIEAARAGEQGRGFAVVADEVRSLASRTQDSTDDIRRMVERLQSMAEQTDKVMQQGKERSERGVEKTASVVSALERISQSIGTVQSQSGHIAHATEQQSVVAEDINRSLVKITGLSDRTSEHAFELAAQATQLSGVADELQQVVNQFKT